MNKRINIMTFWKEFNPNSQKSMKEDFGTKASPNLDKIIAYLENGEETIVSVSSGNDVFTGERIVNTRCYLTDGEYSWSNTLSYYVKKYNLQLPKEFENKILNENIFLTKDEEKMFLVHDESDIPYKSLDECPIPLPSDEEEFAKDFIQRIINS